MSANIMMALFFVLSMTQTAAFAEEGADIKVGSRVCYDGFDGVVLQLWKDEMVRVSFDHDLGVRDVPRGIFLTLILPCLEGICKDDKVITDLMLPGRRSRPEAIVQELYSDGNAKLTIEGLPRPVLTTAKYLSKQVECVNGVCVGNNMLFERGSRAKVKKMFADGTVVVGWKSRLGTMQESVERMHDMIYGCLRGICIGDDVIYKGTSYLAAKLKQNYFMLQSPPREGTEYYDLGVTPENLQKVD